MIYAHIYDVYVIRFTLELTLCLIPLLAALASAKSAMIAPLAYSAHC